jgi:2-polyprenyl-3-methyl-5-hydroxy-6-metoxy-1,4-benzoquinol methylase
MFKRITSNCRPFPRGGHLGVCQECGIIQKPLTNKFKKEVNELYGTYKTYIIDNLETKFLFSGNLMERSKIVLEIIRKEIQLPKRGKHLDFGCGDGALLRTFTKELPDWDKYGYDVSENEGDKIKSINGVKKFFCGELAEILESFDMITAVHSVEHMDNPSFIVEILKTRLNENGGGRGVIVVPNIEKSPFDLLISDHLTHFSSKALSNLFHEFSVKILKNVFPKELFCIVGNERNIKNKYCIDPLASIEYVNKSLNLIDQFRLESVEIARNSKNFGIFGVSNISTWLFSEMNEYVNFFVDEDKDRIWKKYMGKMILPPESIPENAVVFIPFSRELAAGIALRLNKNQRGRYIHSCYL